MSVNRKEQFFRALKFYNLDKSYNRIFTLNGNGVPHAIDQSTAISSKHYAWVQINLTDPSFPIEKPSNADIAIVQNVSLDFELPDNPAAAHAVAEEFGAWLSVVFFAGQNVSLPVEDSGAGSHIVIPIQQLNTRIYGGGDVVNTAVKLTVEKYMRDQFYQICQDHNVQMSLGAYDISRLLSVPGTWRPPSPRKPDAQFLLNGYIRRYMSPYDSIDPIRVESSFLRDLIIQETDEAIKIHRSQKNTNTGGVGGSPSASAQHDPAFERWLNAWVKRNPNGSGNRSDYFHRVVCAAYRRMRGVESIIIDHADLIDDLTGSKYGSRSVAEAQRSIVAAKQMNPRSVTVKSGQSIQDYIDALETLGYTFRLNECGNDVEVNGIRLDPGLYARMCNQMYDLGFSNEHMVSRVWTDIAWSDSYHPIREYLEQCGKDYDGQSYIDQVADCFSVNTEILENDGPKIARTWLRKWFIGAVAKAVDHEQNVVLVLEGPQDIGKSTLAIWLCNDVPEYSIEEHVNLSFRENDTNIRLTRKWIWEIGELGATTRKQDVEALKQFFTKKKVTVRKPYDKHDTEVYALSSFIGTINENGGGFLSDPTGSRRFAIIPITSIDIAYQQINPAKLWGEAYTAYKAGEDWRIRGELARVRDQINQIYYVTDPLMELIPKFFDIDESIKNGMTGSDIAMVLLHYKIIRNVDKSSLTQIGIALRKLGVKKFRDKSHVWIYKGIERKDLGTLAMNSI